MSTNDKMIAGLFAFVTFPMVLFSEGFVIAKLWNWYVVPMFNAPLMTVITAIGISILWGVISLKRRDYLPAIKDDDKELGEKLGEMIVPLVIIWVAFISGWIILGLK